MKKREQLILTLKNNTQGIIPVSMLAQGNPNDTSNAHTRYRWDLTLATFTNPVLRIQVRGVGTTNFTTITAPLPVNSITAVVAALNALNIGAFYQVGSNIVETYNATLEYGQLIVGNATSQVDWSNNTLIAGGNLQIRVNLVLTVNNPNPGITSGSIPDLASAASIKVDVLASALENTDFLIQQVLPVDPFTTTNLYAVTVPAGTPDTFTFAINTTYVYVVTWGTPI